jgi:hypothetical protein
MFDKFVGKPRLCTVRCLLAYKGVLKWYGSQKVVSDAMLSRLIRMAEEKSSQGNFTEFSLDYY